MSNKIQKGGAWISRTSVFIICVLLFIILAPIIAYIIIRTKKEKFNNIEHFEGTGFSDGQLVGIIIASIIGILLLLGFLISSWSRKNK